jgi:hypothetical protein
MIVTRYLPRSTGVWTGSAGGDCRQPGERNSVRAERARIAMDPEAGPEGVRIRTILP